MQNKVLAIEDSATSMSVLKHLINKAKLTPVCAKSLTEAQQIFSEAKPEEYLCAIVDYTLPDALEGEAIDFAIGSYLPTVVVTGRLDDEIREKVLGKDVIDYIPKENAQVYDYLSRLLSRLEKNKTVGVLVVDDSRLSRNIMITLLKRHNFIVYEADGAQAGIDVLTNHNDIKLILTDENMPDISGVEMVAQIRKTYSKEELAIIGVSSSTSSALSARFIKSGANDYLTKPYCHEEFLCRIMQNIEYVENIEAIQRAANSDYLTGLPNRRYFFSTVSNMLNKPMEHKSLALIDLDKFKSVNDTYGHDCGDIVLKEVAKTLAKFFKGYCVARFGGEEFCIFMADTPLEAAEEMMNKFRIAFSEKPIYFGETSINCTLSAGLTCDYDDSIEHMLKTADEHLYVAKEQGRNIVISDDFIA